MCGILAYISSQHLEDTHPAIESINHRGPDDSGIQHFNFGRQCLTLAHKRLSIIDLSKAAVQPMNYGHAWIIFNGEIYNYQELKTELVTLGFQFRTSSDTEVILAAYQHWGKACLERLNGMFAFVIWDCQQQILFVARDRFGIKPLYFWNTTHGLAIVSEIKQLRQLPGFQARLNLEAAFQFMAYADFSYDETTMWAQVNELQPGHAISIDSQNWHNGRPFSPTKWYIPPEQTASHDYPSAVQKFAREFERAIRLQLRADVPIGTALSGGIDSSAITGLIDKVICPSAPYHTFSASYEDEEGDETPFIRAMQKTLTAKTHDVQIGAHTAIEKLDFATYMHDLPILGRAILPYYGLCEFIKTQNIKVVLQGQGADEILAGYIEFHRAFLAELLAQRHYLRAAKEYWAYRKIQKTDSIRSDIRKLYQLTQTVSNTAAQTQVLSYFSPEFTKTVEITRKNPRLQQTVKDTHTSRLTALRMFLHNVDRASMAYGIEVRVPFLDHNLVHYCLNLPSHYKIRKGLRKSVLRDAAVPLLPPEIQNRAIKMGFSSPEATWAKTHLKDFYDTKLTTLENHPLINGKLARQHFHEFLEGKLPYNRLWWRLASFQHWMSCFGISA